MTPVVPLSFAATLRGGITIAENIRMRVLGADGSAKATIAGQQVFYANALQDADVFATPLPRGVETFVQLRSSDSPRTIAYQFDLPDGARLVTLSGEHAGVAIVRENNLLARIAAPVSQDANGALVPTTMSIDGTRLTLRIAVSKSSAFPVLVDPVVVDNQFYNGDAANSNGKFGNTLGWRRESSSGVLADYNWAPNADNPSTGGTCYRVVNNTLGTWDNELCVATQSGRWYTGQLGHWAWRAPGGSRSYLDDGPNITFDGYVYRAYVRHSVTRFSTSNYAYMYAGIRSGRTSQWIGMNRNIQEGGGVDDVRNGPYTVGNTFTGAFWNASFLREYCVNTDCSPESSDPNVDGASFAFGAYALGNTHNLMANALGAVFYQYDRTAPTVALQGDASSWKRSGTVSTFVSASDNGMGMKTVATYYTNKNGQLDGGSSTSGCTGGILSTCPRSLAQTFYTSVDNLPEGIQQLSSFGDDVLGKRSIGPTQTVKIDRTAPTGTLGTPPQFVHGTSKFSGTIADALSGPGRWTLEAAPQGTLNWQAVCSATQASADGAWSCPWNTDSVSEGTYQLRGRLDDSVSPADGGPNVAYTAIATTQVDRTAPTLPTNLQIGSNYVASTQSVVVDWDTADDPDLADGSEGSGVGAYEYRLRVNGGAWTDALTTADITAVVPGAAPGNTVDVELTAFDIARNQTAARVMQITANAECSQATDQGFLAECQTTEMDQPDHTDAEDVDLIEEPGLRSTDNARRFIIDVKGGSWTTIRNAPNSLVIGNAKDGWSFDRTRGTYNDAPGPGSDLGWRAGAIRGAFDACGWLRESAESGAGDKFVDSPCPPKADARISQRRIAPGYNCMGCNRGTRLKLIRPTPMWANVTPNPAEGRPTAANGDPIRTIGKADVERGYYVDWRYVTKPVLWARNFIMVRDVGFDKDQARTDNANGVWVFIRRSSLPRGLCQKSQVTVLTGCGSPTT